MHLSSVEPRPVCRPCSDPRSAKPLLLSATRCAQLYRRLTADLNPSHSPAVACHDALRNEVTIAARFRVVAAETGGGAAPAPETTHAPGGGRGGDRGCTDQSRSDQRQNRLRQHIPSSSVSSHLRQNQWIAGQNVPCVRRFSRA